MISASAQAQQDFSYHFDTLWGDLELTIENPIIEIENADSLKVWQGEKNDYSNSLKVLYASSFVYNERIGFKVLDSNAQKVMNQTDTIWISFFEGEKEVYSNYLLPSDLKHIKEGNKYFYRVSKDLIQVRLIIEEVGPLSGATQMMIFNSTEDTPTGYHIIEDDKNLLRVYEFGTFTFLESGKNTIIIKILNPQEHFFTFLVAYDPAIEKFLVYAKDERLEGEGILRKF